MEIREMSNAELEVRLAEIETEKEAEDADLDKLYEEVTAIEGVYFILDFY